MTVDTLSTFIFNMVFWMCFVCESAPPPSFHLMVSLLSCMFMYHLFCHLDHLHSDICLGKPLPVSSSRSLNCSQVSLAVSTDSSCFALALGSFFDLGSPLSASVLIPSTFLLPSYHFKQVFRLWWKPMKNTMKFEIKLGLEFLSHYLLSGSYWCPLLLWEKCHSSQRIWVSIKHNNKVTFV